MNHKGHNRSSSHGRKLGNAHSRQAKPPPLHRRGQSYNYLPSHGQHAGHSPRTTLGGSRRVVTEVTAQDEDAEDMGFLQFCATCEKQIVTPGNSILYCSEACRRRDVSMPTPPVQPPTPSITSYFDFPATDIVPQRSPTVLRPASSTFSDLTISDRGSPPRDSVDGEAARYHGQFRHSGYGSEFASHQRPRTNRSSTTFESGLPSLSNTPSSSIGTAASWSSYRPLPPRHDPSTGRFPTKSIDLVIPTFPTTALSSPTELVNESSLKSSASTMTSFRVAEASDVLFTRRKGSWMTGDQTSSSLKQLLKLDTRKGSDQQE